MTIDERLERLTERHEALTQSVELLVAENRQAREDTKTRGAQQDERMAQIMEAVNRLVNVAGIHELRLDDQEQRIDNLEQK
jgi:hypothetical protein